MTLVLVYHLQKINEMKVWLPNLYDNVTILQLNEYVTDPCFLQIFQSNTTACLIIHVFRKSWEPEIVLHPFCFDLHYCRTISCSQILQNARINIVVHWKFWKKYRSVSIHSAVKPILSKSCQNEAWFVTYFFNKEGQIKLWKQAYWYF